MLPALANSQGDIFYLYQYMQSGRRVAARRKGKIGSGDEAHYDVWFGDRGTNKKTGGQVRGGTAEDFHWECPERTSELHLILERQS